MALPSKRRAELRAEAHHLRTMVHVGSQGPTAALLLSLGDALRTRELVKVALNRMAPEPPKEVAETLAAATGAEIIQVIGRVVTLYRENPENKQPPPWRRIPWRRI